MEALSFSETSLLTRTTRRNIPEEAILYVGDVENESPVVVWLPHNQPWQELN
jgi:hypothetical protein